ncbi:MAG: hypothetical protein ACFB8W_22280 [Elainellaceae cyanobacterium]
MTVAMTPAYWQAARAIAQKLSSTKTDANELKKVVAYLCWLRNREGTVTGDRLFDYLATLSQHGEIRSGSTARYYQTIEQVCRDELKDLQADGDALIQILGWAGRLQH